MNEIIVADRDFAGGAMGMMEKFQRNHPQYLQVQEKTERVLSICRAIEHYDACGSEKSTVMTIDGRGDMLIMLYTLAMDGARGEEIYQMLNCADEAAFTNIGYEAGYEDADIYLQSTFLIRNVFEGDPYSL